MNNLSLKDAIELGFGMCVGVIESITENAEAILPNGDAKNRLMEELKMGQMGFQMMKFLDWGRLDRVDWSKVDIANLSPEMLIELMASVDN